MRTERLFSLQSIHNNDLLYFQLGKDVGKILDSKKTLKIFSKIEKWEEISKIFGYHKPSHDVGLLLKAYN